MVYYFIFFSKQYNANYTAPQLVICIGDRAFPVATAKVWNTLPPAMTSLPSLEAFKRALKT